MGRGTSLKWGIGGVALHTSVPLISAHVDESGGGVRGRNDTHRPKRKFHFKKLTIFSNSAHDLVERLAHPYNT